MARPFHVGVTASHRFLDPSMHGLDFLRDLIGHWVSGLDIARLGSLAACVGAAPAAWRFLRSAWHETYGWVRQFFISSVTVPGHDPLNRHVTNWVVTNVIQFRSIRSFTARTQVQPGAAADRAALLKKTRRDIQYLPHFDSTWFWHEGNLFVIRRPLDSFKASVANSAYDGVGGEELTIGCLGRSTEPIKRLIQTCQEYADKQAQYFVLIYSRYRMSWQPKSRKPIRRLETVHFDDKIKQELLTDIRKYLDPNTKRLYNLRSMPYRRGYLFYGPPGTGKSSLSTALAGEFGLDLYEVKIPSVATDQDLEQMFQEVPPQCIVLLEDIDAIWTKRESTNQGQHGEAITNCTLSGLLNVLDGVGSPEGRIVIMTTNKLSRLDSALIRPGRVDMKILLGNISRQSAEQMFLRMFAPDVDSLPLPPPKKDINKIGEKQEVQVDHERLRRLASDFATQIPDDTFTPSQLQGFFQLHLDNPVEAASSISAWVERQLSGLSSDDEIEIVGNGHAR
ncbi:mitochondrial chaperone BCS1 [Annulohypoxylon maeteangense]|uniref:mitochondrial chaperone BCS1 n=1 Tax=Annulohypoxylon maeteangense TaxID=1927788 RepID=UPI002007BC53|nr:mitochondrial chaperone BCS1 [Annulohypoxylon maeteangense]KAI0880773.1 mitochondrial chaperone BCS1 [Annulohypoxylon maeteangense]